MTILHEMKKGSRYKGALCEGRDKRHVFCQYRRDLFRSDRNCHVDQCVQCGKRQYYYVKNGRIDSQRYQRDHIRDYIQRGSPLFELIYGNATIIKGKISREEKAQNLFENVYDAMHRAKRLENRGML